MISSEENLSFYLHCQDHMVSKEKFELWKDEELDLLLTKPVPKKEAIEKYYQSEKYISHTDATKSLLDKVYQLVKRYTLWKKERLISSLRPDQGAILDIGAGTGDFLVKMKEKGWKVLGTEPNQNARDVSSKKGIQLIETSESLKSESFDVITMWHVLEHVIDLEAQIKEIKRLLKKEGYLIIAVPNFKSYDAQYYKSFWAAYDVPRHIWHFSENAIKTFFSKYDINWQKTLPMKWDAYYVSLLSEKYKYGNVNPFRAIYTALRSNYRAKTTNQYSSLLYILKNY